MILSYTILIAAVILGHFPRSRSKLVYLGIARNKLTGKRNSVAGAEAERWNNLWLHIQVSVFKQSTRAFSRVGYCKHPWPVNQHNVHYSKLRNRHQRLLRTKCESEEVKEKVKAFYTLLISMNTLELRRWVKRWHPTAEIKIGWNLKSSGSVISKGQVKSTVMECRQELPMKNSKPW